MDPALILETLDAAQRMLEVLREQLATLDPSSAHADVEPTEPTVLARGPDRACTAPADPVPDLLTQRDLARLLRCHPRTVRRMELAGELPPPIGSGRLKRWRRTDIHQRIDIG